MKRSSLRDRMLQSLRQMEIPRGARGRRLGEGVSRLPLRDLIRFLESTGDEQVEYAKKCLWKISFNSPLFPPAILFRRILSLQTAEKALDKGAGHRSRDHIRHLVYLVVLGIYIFTIDPEIQKRFDRQASFQKRKHNLGVSSNLDQFVQAWLSFCIFHDIAYPVERLHSAPSDEVSSAISTGGLEVYKNLVDAYAEEYSTRALANLCALVSLLDFDDASFAHLVLPHLQVGQVAKLKDACKPSDIEGGFCKISYKSLLAARPISVFTPSYARLLASILGPRMLIAVLESESSGRILWLGTIDRSVDIVCDSAVTNPTEAWRAAFDSGIKYNDSINIKYYPAESLSTRDLISVVIPVESAYEDVLQVCRDLHEIEEFRHAARTNETQAGTLAAVAYSALCGSGFVDHSRSSRFDEIEPAVATRVAIEQHTDEILIQLARSFGHSLRTRLREQTFSPASTLITNPPASAFLTLTTEALELDKLLEIAKAEIKRRVGAPLSRSDVESIIDATRKQFQKKSRTIGLVTESLERDIRPKLDESVRRTHAVNRIFGAWLPLIRQILHRSAASPDMRSVSALPKADLNSPAFVRKLFAEDGFSQASPMLSDADQSLLREIGKEYDPAWHVDHGLYAAAIALWSSSLRWSVMSANAAQKLGESEDIVRDGKLVRLIMFNPILGFQQAETELNGLKNATDLCYRSIALHNFYPLLSDSHKEYRHKLGGNPFTYIALLSDALQNWDRDVQYEPGKFDLTELKPDGLYDIYYDSGKLCVVVNRLFFDETRVVKLRKDLGSYLSDLDAIMDIRLG